MLRQNPNTAASWAKGMYGPGQRQGRAGTGQHMAWQQQRTRPDRNAASNTASAWSDPGHTRKRSSRTRVFATELSRPEIHGHSNRRCSVWRHQWHIPIRTLAARCRHGNLTHRATPQKRKTDRTSRQAQAGIGHSNVNPCHSNVDMRVCVAQDVR